MKFKFYPKILELEILAPLGDGNGEVYTRWRVYPGGECSAPELLAIYRESDKKWHPASQKLKHYLEPMANSYGTLLARKLDLQASRLWEEQYTDDYSAYGDYLYEQQRDREMFNGL
jgi:hypothetical protein